MLKNIKAIAFLTSTLASSALAFSISGVAWGEILPQVMQPTRQPVDDSLVCYMQTSEGATLNLNGLCGTNASTPNRRITVSQTSERIPQGLIRYSNTSNGVTCVAIDQQGRPCQTAQ